MLIHNVLFAADARVQDIKNANIMNGSEKFVCTKFSQVIVPIEIQAEINARPEAGYTYH